jgi:hypothetical protein
LERREQADDAPRQDAGGFGQAVGCGEFGIRELIEAARGLDETPLVAQALKIDAGDTRRGEVTRAGDALTPGDL